MPELPEVETVKRTLIKEVKDKKILSAQIYWDNIIAYPSIKEFENQIKNQTIVSIDYSVSYEENEKNATTLYTYNGRKISIDNISTEYKYYIEEVDTDNINYEASSLSICSSSSIYLPYPAQSPL